MIFACRTFFTVSVARFTARPTASSMPIDEVPVRRIVFSTMARVSFDDVDRARMLLARFRRFNAAIVVVLLPASAAHADDVRRWRDTDGKLHLSITGPASAHDAAAGSAKDEPPSDERF